jgi:RNA ligase
VDQGYVKKTKHPDYDLWIYNYTDKATFDRVWDEATMNCRGLILDADNNVVARGMAKFFNHNQVEAPKFDLDDPVFVADKVDGSLGILHPTPDSGWAIATRGSFVSEQAIHATQLFRDRGMQFEAEYGFSQVYEIVYPENRIVLDYGDKDELVLLGVVDNETGRFYPEDGPRGDYFGWMTYSRAISLPPRPNAEGLVLTRGGDGAMLKIKQEDYLAMHKLIYGLSARVLWQKIIDGEDVDEYIATLPDEFQMWAKTKVRDMEQWVEDKHAQATRYFESTRDYLDEMLGEGGWGRKEFAEIATKFSDPSPLFSLLDGKDILPVLWKQVKPVGSQTPARNHNEDVA